MNTAVIPDWTPQGVLPPINSVSPTSTDRSPYVVSLTDVVMRFATSPERIRILTGLLDYRAALHTIGMNSGFQWLDGSFLEEVETLENRSPRDIDVVTFFHRPIGMLQQDLFHANPQLFDLSQVKTSYHVDGYIQELKGDSPEALVEKATYWYSMWSHRRDQLWKGFLQIDLAPVEDITARANLNTSTTTGGQP